jgi:hypothetical protein
MAGTKDGLNLEKALHLRISTKAEALIKVRAAKAGLHASTWARLELYKSLGLVDG